MDSEIIYKYLKDYIYYDELYDKFTIEKCQEWENKKFPEDISKLEGKEKKLGNIKKQWAEKAVYHLASRFLGIERSAKKSDVIQEWMKNDREKDEKIANAREPEGVRCLGCSSILKNCISRDLMNNHQGKEAVLFMFECDKCGKRRAYWENGKEWEYKPTCIKCKSEVRTESIKKDNAIITKYSCLHCGHIETTILNLSGNKEEVDPEFEAKRKKYCLPEGGGAEIMRKVERSGKLMDDFKEREDNEQLYDAVKRIKKLTILELQNLLVPVIEKDGYVKLEFEKPDIQKDVTLGFSVQDSKSGRSDRVSMYDLQRLLKNALEWTNWRLMSEGVNYRLGFLRGRFRGVEGEENLLKLIEGNFKKITK